MEERAREWLRARGLSEGDVKAGAEGRVHAWELAARELAEDWETNERSFSADLDDRQLLHEMETAGLLDEHQVRRVHLADHLFRGATVSSEAPFPGLETANQMGWTKDQHWWFWQRPN